MPRENVNLLSDATWTNRGGVTIGATDYTFPMAGNYSVEPDARLGLDMGWDAEPVLAGDTLVGSFEYAMTTPPEDNVWFTLYDEYTGAVYYQQQLYDYPGGTLGMSGSFDLDITMPEAPESLIFRVARGPDFDAQYAPYGYDIWGELLLTPLAEPVEPVCFWTDLTRSTQVCTVPTPPEPMYISFVGSRPTSANGSGGFMLNAPGWVGPAPNLIADALAGMGTASVLRRTTVFTEGEFGLIESHELAPVDSALTLNYSSSSFGTGVSPNLYGGFSASTAAGLSTSEENLIEVDFNPGGEPLIAYGVVTLSFPS